MVPGEDLERGHAEPSNAVPETSEKVAESSATDTFGPSPTDSWYSRLDKTYNVEVFEIRAGLEQWEKIPFAEVPDATSLPETVSIRLFLVDGLAEQTLSYFSEINKDFFRHHYEDALPYNSSIVGSDSFFGKWSRRVYQDHAQWKMEEKIAKGQPYSLDLITDPRNIRLDHERYERAQRIYRPYSSLEPTANVETKRIRQAVKECVSTCYTKVGNGLIGELVLETLVGATSADSCGDLRVIMFDAPRKVRVTRVEYRRKTKGAPAKEMDTLDCFSEFTSSRQRFKEQLELPANFAALTNSTEHSIRDIIVRLLLDDHIEIMSDFREALDFIDEHMSNDRILRDCLQHWRDLFGQWKRSLP